MRIAPGIYVVPEYYRCAVPSAGKYGRIREKVRDGFKAALEELGMRCSQQESATVREAEQSLLQLINRSTGEHICTEQDEIESHGTAE